MSAAEWLRWAACGCASPRQKAPPVPPKDTTFGDDWSYRAPSTPRRSTPRPSPHASPASSADSRTPLRLPLPPSTPGSETSRWSPDTVAPDTFARQVRHSTSRVVMYLRHRASMLLQPPRWG